MQRQIGNSGKFHATASHFFSAISKKRKMTYRKADLMPRNTKTIKIVIGSANGHKRNIQKEVEKKSSKS